MAASISLSQHLSVMNDTLSAFIMSVSYRLHYVLTAKVRASQHKQSWHLAYSSGMLAATILFLCTFVRCVFWWFVLIKKTSLRPKAKISVSSRIKELRQEEKLITHSNKWYPNPVQRKRTCVYILKEQIYEIIRLSIICAEQLARVRIKTGGLTNLCNRKYETPDIFSWILFRIDRFY